MDVLFMLCILSCFIGVRFQAKSYWPDYMNREKTLAFSGVFVLLVFFRHFEQYVMLGAGDQIFFTINLLLRQLIVTPFLFYSGYGIMISIVQKEEYGKKLPKRIVRIWLQFILVVLLYYLVNCFFGRVYSVKSLFLSFFGLVSIGNSNWYIFAILIMYLLTFLAAVLFGKNNLKKIAFFVSGACVIYSIILAVLKFPSYFYDTIFVYPLGLWFGIYHKKIEAWILAKQKRYVGLLLESVLLIAGLYLLRDFVVAYELLSIIFVVLCVLFTLKIQLDNKWLRFLGRLAFEFYILQRIPMMILSVWQLPVIVYCTLSFGITLVLAIAFRKLFDTLCSLLSC